MEKGGLISWKVWKVQSSNSHSASFNDYCKIRKKLSEPKNLKWIRDEETREWSLVPKGQEQEIVPLATFSSLSEANGKNNNVGSFEDQVGHVFEHIVVPRDTFSGLCLQYKISGTKLRQFNTFSGTNLKLAPAKLLIPVTRKNRHRIQSQDRSSREFLIHLLMAEVPSLRCKRSAVAYLNIAEWDVTEATKQVKEDSEWEEENRLIFIEMNRNSREEESIERSNDTKLNGCKQGTVPCVDALQNFLRKLVNKDDATINEEGKCFEMATLSRARLRPSLECLSETSSVSGDEIEIKDWGASLEHGQCMVHLTVENEGISVKQVLKNLSGLLPSNLNMLLFQCNHSHRSRTSDDNTKSYELQCLIGKKSKEKIQ